MDRKTLREIGEPFLDIAKEYKNELTKSVEIKSYLDWALKGRSAWWLYLIGLILSFIILTNVSNLFVILLIILFPTAFTGSVAGTVALTTLGFLPALIAIPFFTWLLHKRPWWSVALPKLKLDGWKLGVGFLFGLLIDLVVYIAGGLFAGSQISFVAPDLSTYLPLLIVGAITILIQVSAEELFFRGYTMQFIRRFTANPALIVGISGLAFAAIHLGNVAQNGMPWYGILIYLFDGLVYGWLAWRSRSLWMPIGLHWANNFALVVLVGEKANTDLLQGAPLIIVDKLPSLNFMLVASGLVYLLVVVVINAVDQPSRETSWRIKPSIFTSKAARKNHIRVAFIINSPFYVSVTLFQYFEYQSELQVGYQVDLYSTFSLLVFFYYY